MFIYSLQEALTRLYLLRFSDFHFILAFSSFISFCANDVIAKKLSNNVKILFIVVRFIVNKIFIFNFNFLSQRHRESQSCNIASSRTLRFCVRSSSIIKRKIFLYAAQSLKLFPFLFPFLIHHFIFSSYKFAIFKIIDMKFFLVFIAKKFFVKFIFQFIFNIYHTITDIH